MKSLLLPCLSLLITQHFASSQTLRWTHTPTAPTAFEQDYIAIDAPVTDAAGNAGLLLYFNHMGSASGFRILWLSASRGKVLMSADFPIPSPLGTPEVVRVSGTYLMVLFSGNGTEQLLRRYRLVRGRVVESDLPLDSTTAVFFRDPPAEYINRDTAGFYIFSQTPAGSLTAIKRYTIK